MSTLPEISLIKNILTFFLEKENSEDFSNNKSRYYTHTEIDSNVTNFEALSNANRLVFKSKLEPLQVSLILSIFQAIYDKNYFKFSSEDSYIFDDDDLFSFEDFKKMDLFLPKNYRQFIMAYLYVNCNEIETSGNPDYNEDGMIKNEAIYNQLPEINTRFDRKNENKPQKVFEIKDLIEMLDIENNLIPN